MELFLISSRMYSKFTFSRVASEGCDVVLNNLNNQYNPASSCILEVIPLLLAAYILTDAGT